MTDRELLERDDRSPARASASAVASPLIPAPTTATSGGGNARQPRTGVRAARVAAVARAVYACERAFASPSASRPLGLAHALRHLVVERLAAARETPR